MEPDPTARLIIGSENISLHKNSRQGTSVCSV